MTVKTGQLLTAQFETVDATGALAAPTVGPTGTLVVNAADTADVVTIANLAVGRYSFSVTCPALTAGQAVQVRVAATVGGVAIEGYVFGDMADTTIVSDVTAALAIAQADLNNPDQYKADISGLALTGEAAAAAAGLQGADGDTLEDLSDQLDGVAIPGNEMNLVDGAITAAKYAATGFGKVS